MKYPKPRLSLLMFIQFFIWGATGPILSLYLKDCLNFTGAQIGLTLGFSALSTIVSPTIMAFIADRVISSERLLSILNFVGGGLMLLFSVQTEFYPAFFACIAFHIVVNPTVPLINAITFHHAPTDRRKFGNIRVWGTVGWIAVAWFSSFWIMMGGGAAGGGSQLVLLLKISAISSFIMGAYSLTIPPKKIAPESSANNGDAAPAVKKREFFPVDAFKIILKPQVLLLCLLSAMIIFIDKFYSFGAAPFLKQIGFSEHSIMPSMSLGQFPEIVGMAILGFLLKRLGARPVLAAGVALVVFRFCIFIFGSHTWLIYVGLSVHGLAYTFTQITAVISLDGFCGERDRTGVHQLYAVLTSGVGGFLGSYAAGGAADFFAGSAGVINYAAYWAVPLALAVLTLILVAFSRTLGAVYAEHRLKKKRL
jgi:nucleoside transporter